MSNPLHIFGIRHHGPGSARSLRRALDDLKPDCVLIEGPPDANDLIPHVAKSDMVPPVAILIYDSDNPQSAVYYPFAEFSPEWQALRYATANEIPVRFIDLPQCHRMAIDAERIKSLLAAAEKAAQENPPESEHGEESAIADPLPVAEPDPLGQLAHAAGYDDGERWWEHVVEHRRDDPAATFAAVHHAMTELRQLNPNQRDEDEPLREAWMRRCIRQAIAEKHERIAIVCGAWHTPALDIDAIPKKADDDLLKSISKVKTSATWIPWTYDRLSSFSGYGAGVRSPGWYDHLWHHDYAVLESWMSRVARLLREKDIDCSSAHVIEAVRLSETLASFRGRALADLSDIADATRAVFFADSDFPMRLIDRELLVGVRLGSVPEDTPLVPLLEDLQRAQKRLRLKSEASAKPLDLDLRNENDRERSRLLHRLRLLSVPWGTVTPDSSRGKGTFHELWELRWDPGFSIRLIEAGTLGATIERAAAAQLRKFAADSSNLQSLTSFLHDAMLADLGDAVSALVHQIENVSAVAADVTLLMAALPQLAAVLRYGNVRQSDESMVRHIVNGLLPRITVGLGGAVASLNDEAAEAMEQMIRSTHAAVELLESPTHTTAWLDALARITDQDSVHGLVRGRAARILLDAAKLSPEDVARRLSLALSPGADPAQSARWVEGFLSGSGLLLVHDRRLLAVLDTWVSNIPPDTFDALLPLLRRTFSTFPQPERRQIGQLISTGPAKPAAGAPTADDGAIAHARGAKALPLLQLILGGGAP